MIKTPKAARRVVPSLATRWSHARGRKSLRVVPCSWQATHRTLLRSADRRRCARVRILGLITLRKCGHRPGGSLPTCAWSAVQAAVAGQLLRGGRAGVDVAGCGTANRAPRWRMKYPSPCRASVGWAALERPPSARHQVRQAHEQRLHPDRSHEREPPGTSARDGCLNGRMTTAQEQPRLGGSSS